MDIDIKIWCAKCISVIESSENVYCESCIDKKDEELQGLEDDIEDLNRVISGLHDEISRLKKEGE